MLAVLDFQLVTSNQTMPVKSHILSMEGSIGIRAMCAVVLPISKFVIGAKRIAALFLLQPKTGSGRALYEPSSSFAHGKCKQLARTEKQNGVAFHGRNGADRDGLVE